MDYTHVKTKYISIVIPQTLKFEERQCYITVKFREFKKLKSIDLCDAFLRSIF